jgi:6-phospho-3-hexuloisomerase
VLSPAPLIPLVLRGCLKNGLTLMPGYSELVYAVTTELTTALQSVNPDAVANLRRDILQTRRIFVIGMGRSGLRMRAFAMRLMHLDRAVHVVGDVTTPAIGAGDLLLIGSASGRTASLVSYAQKANELNAQVTLITIASESPIGKYADSIVQIAASSPKIASGGTESIQPMGSLFEQALGMLLDIVIMQLMDDLGIDAEAMFSRHANLE